MKVIEMERLTLDGESVVYDLEKENGDEYRDWWCVIETKEEELVYDDFLKHLGEYSGDPRNLLWNKMVIHAGEGMGVSLGDDDMYGYIRPDEAAPEVGDDFIDGDGDEWVVIN